LQPFPIESKTQNVDWIEPKKMIEHREEFGSENRKEIYNRKEKVVIVVFLWDNLDFLVNLLVDVL